MSVHTSICILQYSGELQVSIYDTHTVQLLCVVVFLVRSWNMPCERRHHSRVWKIDVVGSRAVLLP